jgi:DNA adenine methylase
MDGLEMLGRIEDSKASAIYVDPPYLKKGTKYVHDFEAADHKRLAQIITSRFRRTRVVVSYYDEPELDALYPGWTKVDVAVTKGLVNQGRRDEKGAAVKAPEVLLINEPSYVETEGRLF